MAQVLLSGAIVGYFIHAGCDILDAHREKRKARLRRMYDYDGKKQSKKSTHHHDHYHLGGRDSKHARSATHWPEYEYPDSDEEQERHHEHRRRRLQNHQYNHYPDNQFTSIAGYLDSGYAKPVPVLNQRALPSPETLATDYRSVSEQFAPLPPSAHTQSSNYTAPPPHTSARRQGSRRATTDTQAPGDRELAGMRYEQLQEIAGDPTVDQDTREKARRRLMEWQMYMWHWQQQQQQQQRQQGQRHRQQYQQQRQTIAEV